MTTDDFKKMYHSDSENLDEKRKILFEMAACYREMIECEHRLQNNRTTWFLTTCGILFGAWALIVGNYTGSSPFLIVISLLFTCMGIALSWIYQRDISGADNAIECLILRWLNFVHEFFDYSIADLNTDFRIPPIIGLGGEGLVATDLCRKYSHDAKKSSWFQSSFPSLEQVMRYVWIVVFFAICIFSIFQ